MLRSPTLVTRALVVPLLLALALASACSDPDPDTTGRVSTKQLLSDVGETVDLRALVVVQDGRTVAQLYVRTDADDFWDTGSITKSVLTTLVGVAIDEGLIDDVDDTLATLLPSHRDQMSPAVASTTLRELITMTGGFDADSSTLLADLATRDPLARLLRHAPGAGRQEFAYSDYGAAVVAHVLREVTGLPVIEYARARLLQPLGVPAVTTLESRALGPEFSDAQLNRYLAAGFAWPVDGAGVHFGSTMLKLRPLDLARFGQLMLDGGSSRGRRLVSPRWVEEATTSQVQADDLFPGYGYGWWVTELDGHRAFAAVGREGPMLMVVPDVELVVVLVSEVAYDGTTAPSAGTLASVVEDVILPALDR